ncbi:MAG TPA: hypothetical protein VMT46_19515 [Anaerolineaceae bacterium]|nr:hypothetical protein [Anaerolineaceae bacterium]
MTSGPSLPLLECQLQPFEVRDSPPAAGCYPSWVNQYSAPGGQVWLSIARLGRGYLFHFPGLADFTWNPPAGPVACFPAPRASPSTLLHLYRNQVAPMLAAGQGHLIFHASAVVLPGGALAFLGAAGLGKSTLTASFSRSGARFLADDCLMLAEEGDQVSAWPGLPGLRLWPDSARLLAVAFPRRSPKLRFEAAEVHLPTCEVPAPLRAVYLLAGPSSAISIAPLAGAAAFAALSRHAFRLDPTDHPRLRAEFHAIASIAARPLLYRLAFPRDFSLLSAVRQAILAHLSTLPPCSQIE